METNPYQPIIEELIHNAVPVPDSLFNLNRGWVEGHAAATPLEPMPDRDKLAQALENAFGDEWHALPSDYIRKADAILVDLKQVVVVMNGTDEEMEGGRGI